jgi:topoisomerase-4 subunit B
MYTDTRCPNHLVELLLDHGVHEVTAGHCTRIDVTLFEDGSLQVTDDGRGIPVAIDPREGVSILQLCLTRLRASGLDGSAVPLALLVVTALSRRLDCWARREGAEYFIAFREGELHSKLAATGRDDTHAGGTTMRIWPDPAFFDSGAAFCLPQLRCMLRTKAALCPGMRVTLRDEATGGKDEWRFTDDLRTYLVEQLGQAQRMPAEPITGGCHADGAVADYALTWTPQGRAVVAESYLDTVAVPASRDRLLAGFRAGVGRAVRELAEARHLLPHGISLAPEDVWEKISVVLSAKNQTSSGWETCMSGGPSALTEHLAYESLSRWLDLHPPAAELIVQLAVITARARTGGDAKAPGATNSW